MSPSGTWLKLVLCKMIKYHQHSCGVYFRRRVCVCNAAKGKVVVLSLCLIVLLHIKLRSHNVHCSAQTEYNVNLL